MPEGTTPTGRPPDGRKVTMGLENAAKMWPTPYGFQAGNGPDGNEFSTAVRQWVTPKSLTGGANNKRKQRGAGGADLQEQVKQWPTPASRDYKGENGPAHLENGTGRLHLDQLPNFVKYRFSLPDPRTPDGPPSSKACRTLNPLFVEWLMGWPIGWTDCASPVTGFSRWRRDMRTELSMLCSRTPEQASLF